MGCLFEFIFEVLFEVVGEVLISAYVKLMTAFFPEHKFSKKLRERIEIIVIVSFVLLFICGLIGFFFLLDPTTETLGLYMFFIPFAIISVQIIAGIIYQIIKGRKNKE